MPAKEVEEQHVPPVVPWASAPREVSGPMKAVVVASGELVAADAAWLDAADVVIAADGGANALERVGRRPDTLVGDLDSVDPSLLNWLETGGVPIERHPADKEASDTELAVMSALDAGATEVVILGAVGGDRLDHELANLLLLADPALAGRDVRAARGRSIVRAAHGTARLELQGGAGDLVSLLPVGGDVSGITTDGLRWPLTDAVLEMGRSRGLSNEVLRAPASVRIERGTLLVVETALRGEHP